MTATKKRRPAGCGTYGAYQRHRKNDEEPCEPCRKAAREYVRRYRTTSPAARERDRRQGQAYALATRWLIERHRAEFDDLYAEAKEDVR